MGHHLRAALNGRARTVIIASFLLSMAGSVAFAAAYIIGSGLSALGAGLVAALGGLACGIIVWTKVRPLEQVVDELGAHPSAETQREGAEEALLSGEREIMRRSTFARLSIAAAGLLGLSALFPARSLGPKTSQEVYHTKWTPGARLVTDHGRAVRASDVNLGSVLTVFPEGHEQDAASQTLLLRLPPDAMRESDARSGWTPLGFIAYSKICTHAGCPVGLYREKSRQLLCPCHQSVFDVTDGARPVSGPASRALPQLPLQIGADGYLRARSDYLEPVGPGFWQRA
jgi:quinol---cytochrome c reductase iron-sulfur subunit